MSELLRPTFRKTGLSEYCRFISTEDLADLIDRVKGFRGHTQPPILDKIAIPLEEDDEGTNVPNKRLHGHARGAPMSADVRPKS
jgi:hypothetical protein